MVQKISGFYIKMIETLEKMKMNQLRQLAQNRKIQFHQ